jgi:ParB-like chromosome segregation protein Spo0J
MQVTLWPVDRPIPYARNARKIPQSAIDKVAASIKEFGWRQPVVVDAAGVIIAGHTRLLAAQKLGLAEVPVHVAEGLTDGQVKAYRLMDNRSHQEAQWDFELLTPELLDLTELSIDLDLTGFMEDEIAKFVGAEVKETAFPELASGEKEPFQQLTFTLHDEQAEQVKRAMDAAKAMGPFVDSPNENSNGNALARICETFLTEHGSNS